MTKNETLGEAQAKALQTVERYQKYAAMRGGNGFRQISTKPGPVRCITWMDKRAITLVGSKAVPKRIPSDRAQRREKIRRERLGFEQHYA